MNSALLDRPLRHERGRPEAAYTVPFCLDYGEPPTFLLLPAGDPDATWTPEEADEYARFMAEVRAENLPDLEGYERPAHPPLYPPRTPEEVALYEEYYDSDPEEHVPKDFPEDDNASYLRHVCSIGRADGTVISDVVCYGVQQDRRRRLAPDVAICGLPGLAANQNSYRRWEHGPLRLVVEIASPRSGPRDRGPKRLAYGVLFAIEEYLVYDPPRRYLRLYHQWDGERFVEVPADARGWLWSDVAQVYFALDPERPFRLRAYTADGVPVRTPKEAEAAARAEAARAEQEAARATAATELAEREAARATAATARADEEARNRAQLEAELAALKAELQRLRPAASS